MSCRDDEPVAGMLGAIATAIAIVLPAYIPSDAMDWVEEAMFEENRFVSCPHGRDIPRIVPLVHAGGSTSADDGGGGEDEVLLVDRGELDAPDEICVDVRLSRPQRRGRSVHLRIESSMPVTTLASIGEVEIESRTLRIANEDGTTCEGHVQLLELDLPKRRRRPQRLDVEILVAEKDGTPRIAHRSFDVRPRSTT